MRLIIRDNADRASEYVANYIVQRIQHYDPTPEHPFVLGLPTGSSPLGVYRLLVAKYKAGEVSFSNVVTFNMASFHKESVLFGSDSLRRRRTSTLASLATTPRATTRSCGSTSSRTSTCGRRTCTCSMATRPTSRPSVSPLR